MAKKIDLGEMRPDYSNSVPAMAEKEPKKVKEYPTAYIKNPQELGITPEMVGDTKEITFKCRIKSVELSKRAHKDEEKTEVRNEACLELMSACCEGDEREENEGNDTQNALEDGLKDHMKEKY